MKYIIILVSLALSISLHAEEIDNRFEAELKYLEQEALTTDEVKISNSAIQKQQVTAIAKEEKTEESNKESNEENLFFKSKEVKPRRIRSR